MIVRAINGVSERFIAVKYGKSDDLVAGEEGFDTFFHEFQNELDTIGKRPDLLIFRKSDFQEKFGYDISHIPHEEIAEYVKQAVAGIEVRSSAFLIEHYEEAMRVRSERYTQLALNIKNEILSAYRDVLSHPSREAYIKLLEGLNADTLQITGLKVPGWRSPQPIMWPFIWKIICITIGSIVTTALSVIPLISSSMIMTIKTFYPKWKDV